MKQKSNTFSRIAPLCLAAGWLAGLLSMPPAMAASEPLLIPGKSSLYQRVLSIPGARLASSPADTGGKEVVPFTAHYVYERLGKGGDQWLLVGTDRHGGTQGWLRDSDTIAWNQGLTATFSAPTPEGRALLFRDQTALDGLLADFEPAKYRELYQAAVTEQLPAASPVIGIQPPGYLDIRENFYLVPILGHKDVYLGEQTARMLEISSVPLARDTTPAAPARPAAVEPPTADPTANAAEHPYRAGIVFAIDSTLSMDPYIERTRQAVERIYDSLGSSGMLGNVNFGLVAFRDSTQAVPELEYVARTFVTLEQGRDPGLFLSQVQGLKAAEVSSRDFREDAYAGVRQAIEGMAWNEHDARYVVLITDAGAREGNDPLAASGLSAEALRQLARDKGIAIFVLHLLTPSVMADHDIAATQYRELSRYPGIGSFYYGVPTGDLQEFGQVLDSLATQISGQVLAQAQNRNQPGEAPPPAAQIAASEPAPQANPQLAELQEKVSRLGFALRMRYLAQQQGGQPPRVFNAWLLDRDPLAPEHQTLEVRVLLTRDQLSDLHDILKAVLERAEQGLLSPQGFLDELKSLAATITRDPSKLGETTASTSGQSLAELGFMREYIEDLPYRGDVMNLSLEDWQTWPARQQIEFVNRLEEKINYYRALHDHTDLWVSLDGGPVDGDSVFTLALDMLP